MEKILSGREIFLSACGRPLTLAPLYSTIEPTLTNREAAEMGFTNRQILDIALRQSATDLNCNPADFLRDEPVLVPSQANPRARKYLQLPQHSSGRAR